MQPPSQRGNERAEENDGTTKEKLQTTTQRQEHGTAAQNGLTEIDGLGPDSRSASLHKFYVHNFKEQNVRKPLVLHLANKCWSVP